MRTFVVGDIHGQHKALVNCLKACAFSYEQDRLIVLGDVCDRGGCVKEAFDELLKIRHCVYVIGNHDVMALAWAKYGVLDESWLSQGGRQTQLSYRLANMPTEHIDLIERGYKYFEDHGQLFVHAGFDPKVPIGQQSPEVLIWDRELVQTAWAADQRGETWSVPGYQDIFVGHNPTILMGSAVPLHFGNLWLMDTGAGYEQMLTVMNVKTKEFWQAGCYE